MEMPVWVPGALVGALTLLAGLYFNGLRPYLKERALRKATRSFFLVPAVFQHECAYAKQNADEHLLTELSLPPNAEIILDLVTFIKAHKLSYSELIIGFIGDHDKKPYFIKYLNRYILIGKGSEVDPAWGKYDDFIDKHLYYHRKANKTFSQGTVLSSAFTIKTRQAGLYPMRIEFLSDERVGDEVRLFVNVEKNSTITLRCKDAAHRDLDCTKTLSLP